MTAALILALLPAPAAGADGQVERIVTRHVQSIVPPDGAGGVAVALRIERRTLFFNYSWADRANRRPITNDTLFDLASLRKVFEATLLAQAVRNGELRLDDPVAKYAAAARRQSRGRLSAELARRAVQGYADDSRPVSEPGDQQGFYHWPGTSQMYASPRDMAVFLAAISASWRSTGRYGRRSSWHSKPS